MEKTLDRQGRWRSKTVAFRVSPEEQSTGNESTPFRADKAGLYR